MEAVLSVLKFGGTSVGSGERMRRVAHIVAHTYNRAEEPFPVVVVSAMSGVTDQLLRIARFACEDEQEELAREVLALKQRHLEAAEKAVTHREARHALRATLQEAFSKLEQDVQALQAAGQHGEDIALPTARVAAWGERLSVLLVAAAVQECGVQAAPVREEVIITARPQGEAPPVGTVVGADPLMEETRQNAQRLIFPLIERRVVPVAAGFIGRTFDGHVTTLGRNGSDYSASVIGAALDGVEVTIYTDVDAECASAARPLLCRGGAALLVRREGVAPAHAHPGRAPQHPRARAQHVSPAHSWHRRGAGGRKQRGNGHYHAPPPGIDYRREYRFVWRA
jgi:aspartate kinase